MDFSLLLTPRFTEGKEVSRDCCLKLGAAVCLISVEKRVIYFEKLKVKCAEEGGIGS